MSIFFKGVEVDKRGGGGVGNAVEMSIQQGVHRMKKCVSFFTLSLKMQIFIR